MSGERFGTHPPARLEWHPAHDELARGDPETFLLHVAFVHAHGLPRASSRPFRLRPSWKVQVADRRAAAPVLAASEWDDVASDAGSTPRWSRTALQTLREALQLLCSDGSAQRRLLLALDRVAVGTLLAALTPITLKLVVDLLSAGHASLWNAQQSSRPDRLCRLVAGLEQ